MAKRGAAPEGVSGLRRLLIDYDSTLNPGQGNTPLTAERAALLGRFLARWKGAGMELYVLTSSSPSKKTAALKEAGLLDDFREVLSSTEPKRFKSKGDFLAERQTQSGWQPLEQLLADDSIEAVQSVWQELDGEPRREGALAHTLRLPQHSKTGLTQEDLQLLDARVFASAGPATWHAFAAAHRGERFVDEGDTADKCMLDSLPEEARAEVLRCSPPERQRAWLQGRPDSAALIGTTVPLSVAVPSAAAVQAAGALAQAAAATPPAVPVAEGVAAVAAAPATGIAATAALAPQAVPLPKAKAAAAASAPKGGMPPKGKAAGKGGPPPPKLSGGPPKAKQPAPKPLEGGLSGAAAILARVEDTGKHMDENESVEIENVDLSRIDGSARRERVRCPRCEKEVLAEDMESHRSAHSSEILPWLFLGGNQNAENAKELTVRTGITHVLNVAMECNMYDKAQVVAEAYQNERGLGFHYKKLPLVDLADQDLLSQFPEALEFIEAAHRADARHRVLVHCVQGRSRSASVVMAYLMKHQSASLRDAHAHVLRCRSIAMPRKEFVDQLGRLECQLFGCSTPSLTGEEVFAGAKLLNLDDVGKPVEQNSEPPAFTPPPRCSASGEPNPTAGPGKGKGKGNGKGKGKGKGESPGMGTPPPPPGPRSAAASAAVPAAARPPAPVALRARDLRGAGKAVFKAPAKGAGLSAERMEQREELRRQRNREAREREAACLAHWRSMGSASVEAVRWGDARQTMWCSGGSGGAILVQIGDSEAVVVKPHAGSSGVAEVVACEVAEVLGVPVARMRPLPMVSEEYSAMAEALINAPTLVEGQNDFIANMLNDSRQFVGIVEFVPWSVLQGVAGHEVLAGPDLRRILEEVGKLVALDCLLNNVDRVPAIWQNDGNLSNVMVSSSGAVVGIDQQVNAIMDPAGSERHFRRLREFCGDALEGRAESDCVGRIRTALYCNTGYVLEGEAAGWLLAGARDGFRRTAERRAALLAALPEIKARMTAAYAVALSDAGLLRLESRLDSIAEFLRTGLAEIARAVDAASLGAEPGASGGGGGPLRRQGVEAAVCV